ncbi:uncharacterized protein LOC122023779 isoform X2 [Zingiber officinale]|uniref:uncharacterized protein LOC122023779 isoform X2 n=1 Tax=Zingiber officinale TaxID=94328 RepID=UPI001C4DBB6D|nr:uncharacterized protein LOC122023779 isoform X2 [Zingiber officinale]
MCEMLDSVVASSILEFLLRRSDFSTSLTGECLIALPVSFPLSSRLEASLLLRRLSADLSRRSISLSTLHTLEHLYRLQRFPSLLPAFASVAVECTVAPLRRRPFFSSSSNNDAEFFDAVNRIWNCKVSDIEQSEVSELVSPAMREARKEMEAAVVDPALREELVRRETKESALEAVMVFVEEAGKEMGPTFLEAAAEAVLGWEREDSRALSNLDRSLRALQGKIKTLHSYKFQPTENDAEMHRAPRKMNASGSKVLSDQDGSNKGFKLTGCSSRGDHGEDGMVDAEQDFCIDNPTTSRGKGGDDKNSNDEFRLEHSSPLPSDANATNNNDETDFSKKVSLSDEKPRCNFSDADTTTSLDGFKTKKRSLMDRNATASTYEWDSGETEFGQSLHRGKEMNKLRPGRSGEGLFCRRRRRIWNPHEEMTLRNAVVQYGAGNWKLIKASHSEIFSKRTEHDLKDKWRNMTKF